MSACDAGGVSGRALQWKREGPAEMAARPQHL
jgi:hypothetical protein